MGQLVKFVLFILVCLLGLSLLFSDFGMDPWKDIHNRVVERERAEH